jgi:hypothetical protein
MACKRSGLLAFREHRPIDPWSRTLVAEDRSVRGVHYQVDSCYQLKGLSGRTSVLRCAGLRQSGKETIVVRM